MADITEVWMTRDVEATRWQYGLVEMKETLVNFVYGVLSETLAACAVHRMFFFYPTIDMRETTVKWRKPDMMCSGMAVMERLYMSYVAIGEVID